MLKRKNTREQGDIGVAEAISWFVKNGYKISIPISESLDYDLIADLKGKLFKIQVKTSRYTRNGSVYEVSLSTSGGNRSGKNKITFFDERNIDFLFVLLENGKKYLIPKNDLNNKKCIRLGGITYERYEVK